MDFYQVNIEKKKQESDSESDEYSDVILANRNLPSIEEQQNVGEISLPKLQVVLDLDKTLIFPSFSSKMKYDFTLNVKTPNGFKVVYVKKRPHLDDFLQQISQFAEISIFTAADMDYAKQVMDALDPNKTIFSKSFFVDSCIIKKNLYIKDLSILGFDMNRSVLIDDSFMSFNGNYDNGIKVTPYCGGQNDNELEIALIVLRRLINLKDIRTFLRTLNINNGFYNKDS